MKRHIAFGPVGCLCAALIGCGGGSSAQGGAGGASTGGGAGTGGSAGSSAGAGNGSQLPVCAMRAGTVPPDGSGAPHTFPAQFGVNSNSGSALFELTEQMPDGWRVSRLSGNYPDPQLLMDDGILSDFVAGDTIRISAHSECQSFSGCASYVVVENGQDDALIAATFIDRPRNLPGFAQTLGVELALEPVCAFPPISNCFEDETQTQYSLSVAADAPVVIEQHTSQTVTIGGRPYTAWLGQAVANSSEGASIPFRCIDAAGFWWPGSVSLTIVP